MWTGGQRKSNPISFFLSLSLSLSLSAAPSVSRPPEVGCQEPVSGRFSKQTGFDLGPDVHPPLVSFERSTLGLSLGPRLARWKQKQDVRLQGAFASSPGTISAAKCAKTRAPLPNIRPVGLPKNHSRPWSTQLNDFHVEKQPRLFTWKSRGQHVPRGNLGLRKQNPAPSACVRPQVGAVAKLRLKRRPGMACAAIFYLFLLFRILSRLPVARPGKPETK